MIGLDLENPVVRLCVAGVHAEQAGDGEGAAEVYREAWDARSNDLEASIAAHYMARVQADERARLEWNRTALERAEAAGEGTASFLPSLLLNLGHSLEALGELADAAGAYDRAWTALEGLEPAIAHSLRAPIERARKRVAAALRPGA
jgi:tetratricopeptide (TPR) repeat protein